MAQKKFKVDSLDVGGVAVEVLNAKLAINSDWAATEGWVANQLSNIAFDGSTAAGNAIDWNSNTSQFDLNYGEAANALAGTGLVFSGNTLAVDYGNVANAIAGGYLTYNAVRSQVEVNTATLANALAGMGLSFDASSNQIKTDMFYIANALAGSYLSNNAMNGLDVNIGSLGQNLAGLYLTFNGQQLEVDRNSLVSSIAGMGLYNNDGTLSPSLGQGLTWDYSNNGIRVNLNSQTPMGYLGVTTDQATGALIVANPVDKFSTGYLLTSDSTTISGGSNTPTGALEVNLTAVGNALKSQLMSAPSGYSLVTYDPTFGFLAQVSSPTLGAGLEINPVDGSLQVATYSGFGLTSSVTTGVAINYPEVSAQLAGQSSGLTDMQGSLAIHTGTGLQISPVTGKLEVATSPYSPIFFSPLDNGLALNVGAGLQVNSATNQLEANTAWGLGGIGIDTLTNSLKVNLGSYLSLDPNGYVGVNVTEIGSALANPQAPMGYWGVGYSPNAGGLFVQNQAQSLAGSGLGYDQQGDNIKVNAGPGLYVSGEGQLSVGLSSGLTWDPTNFIQVDTDVIATKAYADSIASGLDIKASVAYATVGNISLSGKGIKEDGTTVVAGERVLVKNQTTASENGIWISSASSWTRATDADESTGTLTKGAFTFVESGTNAGKGFVYLGNNTWTQFSETGSFITSIANNMPLYVDTNGSLGLNAANGLTVNTYGYLSADTGYIANAIVDGANLYFDGTVNKIKLNHVIDLNAGNVGAPPRFSMVGSHTDAMNDFYPYLVKEVLGLTVASAASGTATWQYSHGEAIVRVTVAGGARSRISKFIFTKDDQGNFGYSEYGIINVGTPLNISLSIGNNGVAGVTITNNESETIYSTISVESVAASNVPAAAGGGGGGK